MKPIERPILFSTDMVKAILAGVKKQTRRVVGLDVINEHPNQYTLLKCGLLSYEAQSNAKDNKKAVYAVFERNLNIVSIPCPYGKPGDILWVRETFCNHNGTVVYKADHENNPAASFTYKPSIHMPRTASRILLEVENINVDRLNNITNNDSIYEGVKPAVLKINGWFNYLTGRYELKYPKQSFFSLWQKINGKGSTKKNPWVWVVKFKVLNQ